MLVFLLQDQLQPRHFIGDHAPGLLVFQVPDFPFVVPDLLVHIFQLLFYDLRRTVLRDQLVLFLHHSLLLLLVQHLVDLYDFVFELPVALLEFLNVFSPE